MKKLSIIAIFFLSSIKTIGQVETIKDVIVKNDTTYEANNVQKDGVYSHPYIDTGMRLIVYQNPYRISQVSEKKNNIPSGIYLSFYIPSNMPEIRGWYAKGEKDKNWYYWDEEGNLLRKEIWDNGKLLKTIKCNTKPHH